MACTHLVYSTSGSSNPYDEGVHLAFMGLHDYDINPETTWVLYTRPTCHLTSCREWLHHYQPPSSTFDIRFGNNSFQLAEGFGTVKVELFDGSIVDIDNIYYVPRLAKNLISVSSLNSIGTTIAFFMIIAWSNTHYLVVAPT